MKRIITLLIMSCLGLLCAAGTGFAQSNPVPFLNQPLVPAAVVPGSAGFTLVVNGTGFVQGATLNWNGAPLATTFLGYKQLSAAVPAAKLTVSRTVNVTVTNPSPGGGTSSPILFTITNPSSSLTFTASTLQVGLAPAAILSADFNNDGRTDLAVYELNEPAPCYGNYNFSGAIQIFLGNGDGTFSQKSTLCFGSPDFFRGHGWLGGIVAGDFNGDGKIDLVATHEDLGLAFERYIGNGDGTFTADGPYWEDYISPFISGDFNRDGTLDFAFEGALDDCQGIFMFWGNLEGGAISGCNGPGAGPLAAGDFNGDDILDVAAGAFFSEPPLSIRIGTGDGTFAAAGSQPSVTVVNVASITVGDFTTDGVLDLAVAGSSATSVLKGNGDGTFTELGGEPPFVCSNTVITADLNGDGKLDLICAAGGNTVQIYLGNGDGTFQPGLSELVGNGAQALAVGDFNGDGRLDIAVANSEDNTVTILLQTPGYQAIGQPPINSDGSSIFSAKRGVVPVKFTLAQYGNPTCALPPATISVTRTAGGTLGTVDENTYLTNADSGSYFRIDQNACQYVYNLAASSLGVGKYLVDISIDATVVGNAVFALK